MFSITPLSFDALSPMNSLKYRYKPYIETQRIMTLQGHPRSLILAPIESPMLMRLTRVAQEFYCMFYCSCATP